MKYICPLITVKNIERSKNFYRDILQMKIKYDFGENVTFHGDFAIHLDLHYKTLIDGKEIKQGENNFELYFEDDDPAQICEILKKNDVEFVHELREQPWRQKVVRFYDPDKNIIEIGESLEHLCRRLYNENLSINEISKVTYMNEDFIKNAINLND